MNQIDHERSESREPGFSADVKQNHRARHGSDIEREHTAGSDSDEERASVEGTQSGSQEAIPPVDETDVLSAGGPDSLRDVEQPED